MKTAILFRNSLIFIVMGFVLQACEKAPEPLTTNSMIRGNVYWNSDNLEYGTVKVTAKGPYGSKSVIIANNEYFIIDKLGNGTYCLEYAKEGFGIYERCDVQLFGNDTIRVSQVQLYPKPGKFKMPSLTRAYISYPDFYTPHTVPCLTLDTDEKDPEVHLQLKIFISSSSDVSWNNYQFVNWWPKSYYNRGHNSWSLYLNLADRENIPFQTGEKVFIRTYACNEYDRGYVDAYLGLMVFPTLDKSRASNVIEFVMP
jgi:hypothetical protein